MLQRTGRETLGVSLTMVILAALAFAGRFAAKAKIKASMKSEDWLIALGFIAFVAYVAILLQGSSKQLPPI